MDGEATVLGAFPTLARHLGEGVRTDPVIRGVRLGPAIPSVEASCVLDLLMGLFMSLLLSAALCGLWAGENGLGRNCAGFELSRMSFGCVHGIIGVLNQ